MPRRQVHAVWPTPPPATPPVRASSAESWAAASGPHCSSGGPRAMSIMRRMGRRTDRLLVLYSSAATCQAWPERTSWLGSH